MTGIPKALKGVHYISHMVNEQFFTIKYPKIFHKGTGYTKQENKVWLEFNSKGSDADYPNLLIVKVTHSMDAYAGNADKSGAADRIVFQMRINMDMLYNIPPADPKTQANIRRYKWYFEGCAHPLVYITVADILKDTIYRIR